VRCIACNQGCVSRIAAQRDVTCLVNPVCGRELDPDLVASPAAHPGTVLVVGAGPAGMEAARAAAERGHRVVLVEARAEPGGELRAASALPHREGWSIFLRQARERLARAGVELRCSTWLDEALVAALRPHAIVVATGASFARPALGVPAVDPLGLIDVGVAAGRRVLLLGGGTVALGLAEWIASEGAEAVVLSEDEVLDEGAQTGLVDRLAATAGVTLRPDRELRALDADGVTIVRAGAIGALFEERLEPVDVVVETRRRQPRPLPPWLADAVPAGRLHVVGDSKAPRSALEAVHEGLLAGLAV
jgi:NADPH-dependent glutamate synthase beta subunit-like oxidoreductase